MTQRYGCHVLAEFCLTVVKSLLDYGLLVLGKVTLSDKSTTAVMMVYAKAKEVESKGQGFESQGWQRFVSRSRLMIVIIDFILP